MSTESTERKGTLVVLACHGVFDPQLDRVYAEFPEDRPVYESHISYAFQHLVWRTAGSPLLVISGGPTKIQRACSESRSYLELAKARGMTIPMEVGLEEFALTSIENILFSLYVYHLTRGVWPESVEAISWEFKRERFERTLDAINQWQPLGQSWPPLRFFPVGDLADDAKRKSRTNSLKLERAYIDSLASGIDAYFALPDTQQVVQRRHLYDSRSLARKRYEKYRLPF